MKLKPQQDYVVVLIIQDTDSTPSRGGENELDTDQATPRSHFLKGIVEEIGPDVVYIKSKDIVLFGKYSGTPLILDRRQYVLLREHDIVSKLVEE